MAGKKKVPSIAEKDRVDYIPDMDDGEMCHLWKKIKRSYFLHDFDKKGVVIPSDKKMSFEVVGKPKLTARGLWLICLYSRFQKAVSIKAVSDFVERTFTRYPQGKGREIGGTQQCRHLASQMGWYLLLRGEKTPTTKLMVPEGHYVLWSISEIRPNWAPDKRKARSSETGFTIESLASRYNNRCATCGSPEGEYNYLNPSVITKLEIGHKDPSKALTRDNAIPQCKACQGSRNSIVFNDKGQARALGNYDLVNRSSKNVKREIIASLIEKERDLILKDSFLVEAMADLIGERAASES
jgi:hypothetical protein